MYMHMYAECMCFQIWAGVTSYKVDLETKTVVVVGDILPLEVLESVSKVKNAVLWTSPKAEEPSDTIDM